MIYHKTITIFRCPHCYSRNRFYERFDLDQNRFNEEMVICRFCKKQFELTNKAYLHTISNEISGERGNSSRTKPNSEVKNAKDVNNKKGKMAINLNVEKAINIPDGTHSGKVLSVSVRETVKGMETYEYLVIGISVDDVPEVEKLEFSAPAKITPNTKLGKLCKVFGADLETEAVDVEKLFLKAEVQYQTNTEDTPRGTFSRILDGTLKPKK